MARNAKQEFINEVNNSDLKCAYIEYHKQGRTFILKINHTTSDLQQFLDELDFEYDNGYGSQEIGGTIWYKDGTWSSRGEYDGSEWWQKEVCPKINKKCL